MSCYNLYQVATLLKEAHKFAKKEMGREVFEREDGGTKRSRVVTYPGDDPSGWRVDEEARARGDLFDAQTIPRLEAGSDMGHDLAIVRASTVPIDSIAVHASMPMPKVTYDWERTHYEYWAFFLRAMWYLHLRGIPISAVHHRAERSVHYIVTSPHRMVTVDGPGHGVDRRTEKLRLVEHALQTAGIPWRPTERREVDAQYGVIWSPVTGIVKASYVEGKSGALPVVPKNPLFVIEEWIAPRLSRIVDVIAEVGGEVGKVSVKVGEQVSKGDEMLRLKKPWVEMWRCLPTYYSTSSTVVRAGASQ